ncbi:putative heat repeat-containing PBS lyase [metagenome]
MGMSATVIDEDRVREMPLQKRLEFCEPILKNEQDESRRWDAVWLAGEIAEIAGPKEPIFDKVADLMVWILENDDNGVVKHEACFQIAARNMRKKIPNLVNSAFYDKSALVKHEAIESLGLMRAFEVENEIKKALNDPSPDVSETARFVLKRLERTRNITKEYVPSQIL